jgi:hypothetical protein
LAYLNGSLPSRYPDQAKFDRATILLATPQLVEMEIDRISSLAAQNAGAANGYLWKKNSEKAIDYSFISFNILILLTFGQFDISRSLLVFLLKIFTILWLFIKLSPYFPSLT